MTVKVEGSRGEDNGDRKIYERTVSEAVAKEIEKQTSKKHKLQGSIFGTGGTAIILAIFYYITGTTPPGMNQENGTPAPVSSAVNTERVMENVNDIKALNSRIRIVESSAEKALQQIEAMVALENLRHQNENREFEQYKDYIKTQMQSIETHLIEIKKKIPNN